MRTGHGGSVFLKENNFCLEIEVNLEVIFLNRNRSEFLLRNRSEFRSLLLQ